MTSGKGTGTFLCLFISVCHHTFCIISCSFCLFLILFLCVPYFALKSVFPAATGQGPLCAVWSLLLLLCFLVKGDFPESPGLL